MSLVVAFFSLHYITLKPKNRTTFTNGGGCT